MRCLQAMELNIYEMRILENNLNFLLQFCLKYSIGEAYLKPVCYSNNSRKIENNCEKP